MCFRKCMNYFFNKNYIMYKSFTEEDEILSIDKEWENMLKDNQVYYDKKKITNI